MNKPDPRTLAPASDIPKHYYAFPKENKPDGKYICIEVWEDGHPDKAERKLLETDTEVFMVDETKLDSMLAYWQGVVRGAGFENPFFTIQGDIGNGSEVSYGYKDEREGIPPNASSYTIKPIFDKNIMLLRHGEKQGKSIVYHSPLDSSTLREELANFNKLLARFFNGEFYELVSEQSDRSPGWEFRNEVIVDNARLRSNNL